MDGRYGTFNEIIDGQLWLGPATVPNDQLQAVGITHIVNVTPGMCHVPQVVYFHVPIPDNTNVCINDHFESTYQFIDNAIASGGRVYVHCVAGVSRSSTIVIYYVMRKSRMSLFDAYHLVRDKRPFIRPNIGFFQRLCDAELQLFGEVSYSSIGYTITYMVEVFELPEADVRQVLDQHQGDVVAAEPDLLRLKFGDLYKFLM